MEISRLFWFIFPALCFSLFTLIPKTEAVPTFLWVYCPNQTTYASNSSISYNFTSPPSSSPAGSSRPKNLVLCRGDVSALVCEECIAFAFEDATQMCPSSRQVMIWFEECMLRHSDQPIPSVLDQSYRKILTSPDNVMDTNGFNHVLGEVMDDIATRASRGDSVSKFAVGESNLSALQKLYGLAQCMPDLTNADCYLCLRSCISAFPTCCNGSRGARVLYPSCNVRYEMYLFYNATAVHPPPPRTTTSRPGSIGKNIAIGVSVSVFVVVALLGLGIYFKRMRRRTEKEEKENNQEAQLLELAQGRFGDDYITENLEGERHTKSKEFPSIQLDLILVATKQFSKENKLGEGGFGPVYKGTLPDGKEIAVKRLSKTSGQGLLELKNEVTMIARLQHRNLVKLLGCCLEGNEALLVYEYMANKSLDVFLFDSTKGAELDWKRRLLIIKGITRGLLYLHEDSRLRIIHRDLKASNVLLDHEMNPKISDFGMARIFGGNQSEANTNRVVGTYGYMAPEYAMEGLFSVKSDVFSFGVLLLEIISWKKNSGFHHSMHGHSLLTFVWKLWSEGRGLELVDPLVVQSCVAAEASKCIHIGLLCVQEDPADRPTMSFVVVMLATDTVTLPQPTQPAFSVGRHALIPTQSSLDANVVSTNELTMSNLSPR